MTAHRAADATRRVLTNLVQRLDLREGGVAGHGARLTLAPGGVSVAQGALHLYTGAGLDKLVFMELSDQSNLEAAALYGFTAPDSAVPHLALDVAHVGRDYAVFVDLLPRLDLAVHPDYVRRVYAPLTAAAEGFARDPRLKPAAVPMSLAPCVSPWMRGFRCTAERLGQLFELTGAYVSEWASLVGRQLGGDIPDAAALIERDRAHRRQLFDPRTDPLWEVLGNLIGPDKTATVLGLLREPSV